MENAAYKKISGRNRAILIIMLALLLAMILLSLKAGSYSTSISELVSGIFGKADDNKINAVVQGVRLPRICTAIVCGVGLGITGCVLQAVLQNPLASASTLGISQGAGFGAAFAIIGLGAGVSGSVLSAATGAAAISLCSFVCSILVSVVILGISKLRQVGPEAMVLAGVALSALFTGATTLLQYFANEVQLSAFVFWTFGDLGSTSWTEIGIITAVVLVFSVYFALNVWNYNALYAGEHTATSLGINVRRTRVVNMLACSFVAATIVSYIGIINFIGLIAPHIMRRLVGENYRYLIPGSAIMGAILLLFGDLISRSIASPIILPIGAITSFLGAPMFLYLLFKGGKRNA